ncbi:MAG: bifunctional metallophosphatase/5'-nucleotidase [Fimbriimonadaceae bacterium]
MLRIFTSVVLLLSILVASAVAQKPLTVTFIHNNDVHGRVEPTTINNREYGGVSRTQTLIREVRNSATNPILLSAGDVFQGTLYFNVYEGLGDLAFMNLAGFQAMAVGNHEFDRGPEAFARFIEHATFPVLACNLDLSEEPALRDLIKPYVILEVEGQKIGIIGAVVENLREVTTLGPNIKELPVIDSVREQVKALQAQGVNKIVLLSHCGFSDEMRYAQEIPELDVVIGGHSHTLLGEFEDPNIPEPRGSYPMVVEHPGGKKTLVVQAWQWGKILGVLEVEFDAEGNPVKWSENSMLVVDDKIEKDPTAESIVAALAKPIEELRATVIGSTDTGLGGDRTLIRLAENTMGNVIADAMLESGQKAGAQIAFMNSGGIRAIIPPGEITYDEAITVQPFGNTMVVLELTGDEIRQALEHAVSRVSEGGGGFLQVSRGFQYTFDATKPVGERVVSFTLNDKPLAPNQVYRVVLNNFTANGGDGFRVFAESKGTRIDTGDLDLDVLIEYIKANSPVNRKPEGRITRVDQPSPANPSFSLR